MTRASSSTVAVKRLKGSQQLPSHTKRNTLPSVSETIRKELSAIYSKWLFRERRRLYAGQMLKNSSQFNFQEPRKSRSL